MWECHNYEELYRGSWAYYLLEEKIKSPIRSLSDLCTGYLGIQGFESSTKFKDEMNKLIEELEDNSHKKKYEKYMEEKELGFAHFILNKEV